MHLHGYLCSPGKMGGDGRQFASLFPIKWISENKLQTMNRKSNPIGGNFPSSLSMTLASIGKQVIKAKK